MVAPDSPRADGLRSDADLELVDHVIIDGDNLLHAVRGSRDAGGVAWLLPRLRAWRPPDLSIIVALDGHADRGLGDRRPVAPGMSVRHGGLRSADDLIVSLVETRPYAERARTLVVTDDGQLRDRIRHAGATSKRVAWLVDRLSGRGPAAGPDTGPQASIGQRRSPRTGPAADETRTDEDPRPWQPGRGATRKRGNPSEPPIEAAARDLIDARPLRPSVARAPREPQARRVRYHRGHAVTRPMDRLPGLALHGHQPELGPAREHAPVLPGRRGHRPAHHAHRVAVGLVHAPSDQGPHPARRAPGDRSPRSAPKAAPSSHRTSPTARSMASSIRRAPHAAVDRADLSVACPVDGTVRAASIQTCPACGTRFVLGAGSSPTLVTGRSGPPEGGAAIA